MQQLKRLCAPYQPLQQLLGRRLLAVSSRYYGLNAATDVEVTDDSHPSRGRARDQVVENSVDCPLVEDSIVPVAPQIELEALELDALRRRNVSDTNSSEVRGASFEQR